MPDPWYSDSGSDWSLRCRSSASRARRLVRPTCRPPGCGLLLDPHSRGPTPSPARLHEHASCVEPALGQMRWKSSVVDQTPGAPALGSRRRSPPFLDLERQLYLDAARTLVQVQDRGGSEETVSLPVIQTSAADQCCYAISERQAVALDSPQFFRDRITARSVYAGFSARIHWE